MPDETEATIDPETGATRYELVLTASGVVTTNDTEEPTWPQD